MNTLIQTVITAVITDSMIRLVSMQQAPLAVITAVITALITVSGAAAKESELCIGCSSWVEILSPLLFVH